METVFLETNAINACFLSKYSGLELHNILLSKNFLPIISQHTTYELMRNFISEKNKSLGISLFKIVKELNPTFSCQTSTLLQRELGKLIDANAVASCDYIIEPEYFKALTDAIDNITQGQILPEYIASVKKRDSTIKNEHSLWLPLFDRGKIANFENFYLEVANDSKKVSLFIYEIFEQKLSETLSLKLIKNIDKFKVIRTAIRANLYMSYIARQNKIQPSFDKNDDFRHLIDGALCTYFVTDDVKLKEYARQIHPELKIITFSQLIES